MGHNPRYPRFILNTIGRIFATEKGYEFLKISLP